MEDHRALTLREPPFIISLSMAKTPEQLDELFKLLQDEDMSPLRVLDSRKLSD